MARSAGQLHGGRGGRSGVPPSRRQGPRHVGRLPEGEDAGREREPPRRSARVATARRRSHGWAELEVLHPVGQQVPEVHAQVNSRVQSQGQKAPAYQDTRRGRKAPPYTSLRAWVVTTIVMVAGVIAAAQRPMPPAD